MTKLNAMQYLYVWATGLVEQGPELPEGVILLKKSKDVRCRSFAHILANCRSMYDDSHVIGNVHDANETDPDKKSPLNAFPDDTPKEALNRWLAAIGEPVVA